MGEEEDIGHSHKSTLDVGSQDIAGPCGGSWFMSHSLMSDPNIY